MSDKIFHIVLRFRRQSQLRTVLAAGLLFAATACVSAGYSNALHGQHGAVGRYVADVYQTSQAGDNLALIATLVDGVKPTCETSAAGRTVLTVQPQIEHQEYIGIGASFTDSRSNRTFLARLFLFREDTKI